MLYGRQCLIIVWRRQKFKESEANFRQEEKDGNIFKDENRIYNINITFLIA